MEVRVEPPDSTTAHSCLQQYFVGLSEKFEVGFDPALSNLATVDEMRAMMLDVLAAVARKDYEDPSATTGTGAGEGKG